MMMKRLGTYSFCWALLFGLSWTYAQTHHRSLAYQDASNSYQQLQPSFAYPDFQDYEAAQASVREAVSRLMADDPGMNRDFAALGDWLKVVVSPDQTLRICSWDEKSGGTMRDMGAMAQVKIPSGGQAVMRLDPLYPGMGEGTDVMYEAIYPLEANRYLVIGVGSYGAGTYHRSARLLQRVGHNLRDVPSAFGADDFLELIRPLGQACTLEVDLTQGILRYPAEAQMQSRGQSNMVIWQYQGGRFVRQE